MRFGGHGLLAAAIAALAPALASAGTVSAAPAIPLSKIEARTLPPERVRQRVIEQLGEILLPAQRSSSRVRPVNPLTEMSFQTRPHATRIAGLCESDSVQVDFRAVGRAPDPAEIPVKAVGLQARRGFRFLVAPKSAEPADLPWDDNATADRQCARLDPLSQNFFEADEAGLAAEAAWLYSQVLADAGRKPSPFALECRGGFDCAADLAARGGLDSLQSAERCEGEPLKNIGCWSLMISGDLWLSLNIYATNDAAAKISRVVVSEPIVTLDERRD